MAAAYEEIGAGAPERRRWPVRSVALLACGVLGGRVFAAGGLRPAVAALYASADGPPDDGSDGGSAGPASAATDDDAATALRSDGGDGGEASDDNDKPHVFFVLVDDMGYNDVGYQSHDMEGVTPFIDGLAKEGVRLKQYYSMHMCTPARAALISGHYPMRIGMQLENIKPDSPWGMPRALTTMPEVFKTFGYGTHAVGKWGLGHSQHGFLPVNRGFDTFYGYLADEIDYFSHEYPAPFDTESEGGAFEYFTDYVFMEKRNPFDLQYLRGLNGTHSSQLYTRRLQQIFRQANASAEPLFVYYASQMTHGPLDVPPRSAFSDAEWARIGDDVRKPVRRKFASLLLALDQSIALSVNEMRAQGLWKNAIFVFASDNGGCWAQGGTNYPLRGGKHFLWEGGVKVPAFVYSTLIPPARRDTAYDGLFHVTDWFPTLLRLAYTGGDYDDDAASAALLKLADVDGLYQWDALMGAAEPPRVEVPINVQSYAFTCTGANASVLRDADSLGAISECANPWHIAVRKGNATRAALRYGDWKLMVNEFAEPWYGVPADGAADLGLDLDGPLDLGDDEGPMDNCGTAVGTEAHTWLFNLRDDPSESVDLSDEYPEVLAKIKARLTELQEVEVASIWKAETSEAYGAWEQHHMCISPWLDAR